MKREIANPSESLGRFIQGIYAYYADKGYPVKTAKAKMIDDAMSELVHFIKVEKDVPDELIVLLAQQVSGSLYERGTQITKSVRKKGTPPTEETLEVLRLLKETTMALDTFVSNYTGWSE